MAGLILKIKIEIKSFFLSFVLVYLKAPLIQLSAFIKASLTFLLISSLKF
jgi:hypothetical protein